MRPRQFVFSGRAALFASAAFIGFAGGALAADKPATPAGAKKIADVFATYLGKSAGVPPALVVTPEGSDYAIAFDIGAANTPLSSSGVGYEPAILKYKAFEQDDGAWRVEQSDLPPIKVHSKQGDQTVETVMTVGGLKVATVIDPATSWFRTSKGTVDKLSMLQTGAGVNNDMEMASLSLDATGKSNADGVVSMDAREPLGPINMKVSIDPKVANPNATGPAAAPVNLSFQSEKADIGLKLDGLKIHPALDLWAFLVAHPTRAELAADEADLKRLAMTALSSQVSVHEEGSTPKLTVTAQPGDFVFEGFKGAFTLAAAGPASRLEEHFAATGMKFPDGYLPKMISDLVPTAFDLNFNVSGFDLTAAGAEAISDMHLDGDAPPIASGDNAKVFAKLIGGAPVVLEITPSHVLAPQLDLAIEGKVTYAKGKPTGAVTIHMCNFDKTVTAMKALGPDTEKQMLPVLTMAKGLAKNDPDGSLSWVGEIGADGVMKVNGLPLGKSPF